MEFKDIKNIQMLSEFLGIDQDYFQAFMSLPPIIYKKGESDKKLGISSYVQIKIPKMNKKDEYRIVYKVINSTILNSHKELQSRLNKLYKVPDCVHGFVHGKNICSNASAHLAKKIILKIDIKNFFESIDITQVALVFQKLGCNLDISTMIAKLVTLNGNLVAGFVTSPVIANLVLVSMDNELSSIYNNSEYNYTRYADDITISSNLKCPDINNIESIINTNGFRLNNSKTLVSLRGKRQYVTGLTVFDNLHPRITKRVKRNLRLKIHYLKTYGVIEEALHMTGFSWREYEDDDKINSSVKSYAMSNFRNLKGKIDFINSVEPLLAKKLYKDIYHSLDISNEISDTLQDPYHVN